MSIRLFRKAVLFLVTLCCAAGISKSQVRTTGQLSGTVVDVSGGVVAGALVTVAQPTTGFSQTTTTNESGAYLFPALQPGTYQVKVSAKGFTEALLTDVVIGTAHTTDLKVELKVGESNQVVEVSTQGDVLETTSNTLSSTISPEDLQNLPLAGRDVLPFAQLVPGAQSGGDQRFTTYNALPNAAINITVDGVNDNFQRYRTSTTGFYTAAPLRLGAFDEVTVSTDSLTADAGAEGSVQLRFVTKHGTNQFHGSAFWQTQNSALNANSYTNNALGLPISPFHLNDYGGSIGGPFWKNKLFFFVNYEEEDNPFSSTTSVLVPTPQAQSGVFTYTGTDNAAHTVNLLTLAQQNGFPNVANSVVSNIFSEINGFAQNQTLTPVAGEPFLEQFSFFQRQSNTNRYPTARLDFQATSKVALHASWDLYWRNIANTEPYPGDKNINNGFKSTYYTAMIGADWTITPRLINQFNFGILSTVEEFNPGNNFTEFQGQGNVQIGAPALTGVSQQSTLFNPVVPSFIFPLPRNNPLWTFTDNLSWTRGNHTFTFGGDVRISTMRELESDSPPTYNLGISAVDPILTSSMFSTTNFPSIDTATDLFNAEALYATIVGRLNSVSGANYVDGVTKQYQVAGALNYREAQTVGGIYFQDAYRITPHLALNYGFRWQFTGAIYNTNDFTTSPTFADLLGPSSGLFQPGTLTGDLNPQVALRPSPYTNAYKQPSPNFGFAWNPTWQNGVLGKLAANGNLVIRGGIRISRFDEGWTTFEEASLFGNPGPQQAVALVPVAPGSPLSPGQFPAGSLSLGSTIVPGTNPASFSPPFPESLFTFQGQPVASVDPHIRPPYVESWNFGVQRKLPSNTVLEINYVGNHSVHLWQNEDLNEVNIFENGFLQEFKNAQTNLGINGGSSFADNTGLPGIVPLPIFDAAFGGAGNVNFGNTNFIQLLQQGQAGALAYQLASSPTFLCNMVGGTNFAPCAGFPAGKYPINFFQVNPYAAGEPALLLTNPGSESYNGLQVQVKHPVGHGVMLMANYAYSHALTNRYIGDYFTADEALENFITLRNPSLNRGPSPYDLRHTFRAYATYDLPFGDGKQFKSSHSVVNKVIGGWTAGTIVTAQSGRNFKLQGGFNTFNYYSPQLGAPDTSDSGVVLNGVTRAQLQNNVGVFNGPTPGEPVVFLNPNLFANGNQPILPETTPGQLGDFIYLTGPRFFNADISIIKSIPIYERLHLNFYAEMINAFNHPNWNVTSSFSGGTNNPAQYVNVSNVGTYTAASIANPGNGADGARSIQFRLQLQF